MTLFPPRGQNPETYEINPPAPGPSTTIIHDRKARTDGGAAPRQRENGLDLQLHAMACPRVRLGNGAQNALVVFTSLCTEKRDLSNKNKRGCGLCMRGLFRPVARPRMLVEGIDVSAPRQSYPSSSSCAHRCA